jgi:hypothetical protein
MEKYKETARIKNSFVYVLLVDLLEIIDIKPTEQTELCF